MVYEVLQYVNEHLGEKLTAEEVAEKFGYSKWYFSTLFKRVAGTSFVSYVRRRRLYNAVCDILGGDKVIDVAVRYGYDTPNGFNKAFLTEFGCYPKQYKKMDKLAKARYRERRDSMYCLTDRCEFLRKRTMDNVNRKMLGMKREYFFMRSLDTDPSEHPLTLQANALAAVIRDIEPFIDEGELIVGYNYDPDNDAGYNEVQARECLTEEQAEFLKEHNNHELWRKLSSQAQPVTYSPEEQQLHEEWAVIGRCINANHSVLGYDMVLRLGFEGLMEKIDRMEAQNGQSALYDGVRAICRAACEFGEKYAEEARRQLQDEALSEERREELEKIVSVCENVPRKPATSFWEAVQSLYFAHIFNTWEDGVNANSLGRMDQLLYPYYRADIDSGKITREFAFELICCLWIKLYRSYDVQQSAVGGCDENGDSAVNDLSYMMLEATEKLDFIRCLSVRYDGRTDREFMKRALEVVGHLQMGVPFFFNDDVMIPALVEKGVPLEDARGYTQIGCVETVIPGKSNPHAVTGETNLLKAIEYALNDGRSMLDESLLLGPRTGAIQSYADLKAAVFAQIDHILTVCCRKVYEHTEAVRTVARPYKSLLTEGCLESNRDFNDHGALYDYYQIMLGGIPNLADSMMALKKFVFEEKKYTLDEVIAALKADYPDERMRLTFINNAPKFGNDIDEVDDIAAEITDFSCDCLDRLSAEYGLSFHAQPFTFLWMVPHGEHTAATPDGRHAGENIAYSVSPMQGRDFNGFTAVLNSICKLPTRRTPGTTSAIVEVDPKLFTDNNIGIFADIMLAAADQGLQNIQFNVVDAGTLMEAQKYPDKYNNLCVRVSGFSQKFNLLDKKLQDHIIGRTKHKCM